MKENKTKITDWDELEEFIGLDNFLDSEPKEDSYFSKFLNGE